MRTIWLLHFAEPAPQAQSCIQQKLESCAKRVKSSDYPTRNYEKVQLIRRIVLLKICLSEWLSLKGHTVSLIEAQIYVY